MGSEGTEQAEVEKATFIDIGKSKFRGKDIKLK
jgi:hypothetical protein